ncbi:MAG: hypothetical protein HY720_20820 [Planctomycetes bacterium]|nr:hypothetical protein [Planctomycetota bacterium]
MGSRARRERDGVGLTEYVILVVLVAIALLGAVAAFGGTVQEKVLDADVEVMALDAGGPPGN